MFSGEERTQAESSRSPILVLSAARRASNSAREKYGGLARSDGEAIFGAPKTSERTRESGSVVHITAAYDATISGKSSILVRPKILLYTTVDLEAKLRQAAKSLASRRASEGLKRR